MRHFAASAVGECWTLCQLVPTVNFVYSKAECNTHQTSGHVCRRLPSLIFRALCYQFLHVMTSNDMTTCPDMTICRSSNHASMGEECRDQTQRLSSRRFLTKASVKVNLVGICTDFVCKVLLTCSNLFGPWVTVLNSGENSVKAKCAKSGESCRCKRSWPPHHHVPRAAPRGSHQWGPNLSQTPKSSWSLWNKWLVMTSPLYVTVSMFASQGSVWHVFGCFCVFLLLRLPKQTSLATWRAPWKSASHFRRINTLRRFLLPKAISEKMKHWTIAPNSRLQVTEKVRNLYLYHLSLASCGYHWLLGRKSWIPSVSTEHSQFVWNMFG